MTLNPNNPFMFHARSLRQALADAFPDNPPNLVFPPPHLCTDNAVMIAWAGMHRFAARDFDTYDLSIRPKWRIDDYTGKALARLQWVSRPPHAFPVLRDTY